MSAVSSSPEEGLLRLESRLTELDTAPDGRLVLAFDQRCRSRFRAATEDGKGVAVLLPRGSVLRGGDRLRAHDGRVIEIVAAAEPVSTVHADDPLTLARAAYHLGNRHVPLEIGAGWLRYRHDHVLDDMVRALGARVVVEEAPFEPEAGAYHRHDHPDHEHGTAAT
jgi:urease accessory protein